MTLVIKRKEGQTVRIGEVLVTVQRISRSEVKLGIDAPAGVDIVRGELEDEWTRHEPVDVREIVMQGEAMVLMGKTPSRQPHIVTNTGTGTIRFQTPKGLIEIRPKESFAIDEFPVKVLDAGAKDPPVEVVQGGSQEWVFLFGPEHRHPETGEPLVDRYVKMTGWDADVRRRMFRMFGSHWSHSSDEPAEKFERLYGTRELPESEWPKEKKDG